MNTDFEGLPADVLSRLAEMEEHQHARLLALARERVPRITTDDLKNPDDHPVLHHDPHFNYEDGVLSGIRMAAVAVREALRARKTDPGP